MAVLTDTNILLRLLQLIILIAAMSLRKILWSSGVWPRGHANENGLGLTTRHAAYELDQIRRLWTLVPETPIAQEWETIVKRHGISGKNTHDARLVAAMHVNGIQSILTFNARDFVRYPDITVLEPSSVT